MYFQRRSCIIETANCIENKNETSHETHNENIFNDMHEAYYDDVYEIENSLTVTIPQNIQTNDSDVEDNYDSTSSSNWSEIVLECDSDFDYEEDSMQEVSPPCQH